MILNGFRPAPACFGAYGCGYNSCGCNLRLSEVRSGLFGVDLEAVWGPLGPKPAPKRPQNRPQTTSNCSHMSCSHIHGSPISGAEHSSFADERRDIHWARRASGREPSGGSVGLPLSLVDSQRFSAGFRLVRRPTGVGLGQRPISFWGIGDLRFWGVWAAPGGRPDPQFPTLKPC